MGCFARECAIQTDGPGRRIAPKYTSVVYQTRRDVSPSTYIRVPPTTPTRPSAPTRRHTSSSPASITGFDRFTPHSRTFTIFPHHRDFVYPDAFTVPAYPDRDLSRAVCVAPDRHIGRSFPGMEVTTASQTFQVSPLPIINDDRAISPAGPVLRQLAQTTFSEFTHLPTVLPHIEM